MVTLGYVLEKTPLALGGEFYEMGDGCRKLSDKKCAIDHVLDIVALAMGPKVSD